MAGQDYILTPQLPLSMTPGQLEEAVSFQISNLYLKIHNLIFFFLHIFAFQNSNVKMYFFFTFLLP
jgi:hypothetical protein